MKQRFISWHTPNKMFTFVAKIAAVASKGLSLRSYAKVEKIY